MYLKTWDLILALEIFVISRLIQHLPDFTVFYLLSKIQCIYNYRIRRITFLLGAESWKEYQSHGRSMAIVYYQSLCEAEAETSTKRLIWGPSVNYPAPYLWTVFLFLLHEQSAAEIGDVEPPSVPSKLMGKDLFPTAKHCEVKMEGASLHFCMMSNSCYPWCILYSCWSDHDLNISKNTASSLMSASTFIKTCGSVLSGSLPGQRHWQ